MSNQVDSISKALNSSENGSEDDFPSDGSDTYTEDFTDLRL